MTTETPFRLRPAMTTTQRDALTRHLGHDLYYASDSGLVYHLITDAYMGVVVTTDGTIRIGRTMIGHNGRQWVNRTDA